MIWSGSARDDAISAWVVFPSALATGCAVGIIAAGLQSAVPDLLMTVAVVVFEVAVPLALTPWIRRRVAKARALG